MDADTQNKVETIFQTAGDCVNLEVTKSTLTKVISQLKQYQEIVHIHIEDNFVEFLRNDAFSDSYIEEGENLLQEANEIMKRIANESQISPSSANVDLIKYTNELRETVLGLQITIRILKIDDLFQCVEEANATREYSVVLELLEKLQQLIYVEHDVPVDRIFQTCHCCETIKVKYHVQAHILKQNLQQKFENLIQLKEKQFPSSKSILIQLSKDDNELQDIMMTFFQAHCSPISLCDFLLNNCLEPIIKKPVSIELNEDGGEFVQLKISYSSKELNHRLRPNYKQVIENIRLLMNVMNKINVSVSKNEHVFTIVGNHINERFLRLLVEECFMLAVPETIEEYKESTLLLDVTNFEQYLADILLIDPEKNNFLTEFREKYENFFRTSSFKKLREIANDILGRDLQDMISTSEGTTADKICNDPTSFPKCMISKSVLEFTKLLEHTLQQSLDVSSTDLDERVPSAVAFLLNTYITEVPKRHIKLLESIPQQSVLFYNNCMFLSHWVVLNFDAEKATFLSLVKSLQSIGKKYLEMQVSTQRKLLLEILNEFELSEDGSLGTTPLKLVRQCMRQMDLLKNVWQNVLPDDIYNINFCDILNDFCNNIIKRIMVMEDISATLASDLSKLIDIILEKGPQLFKEKHEVVHIKSWMKLQQLKTILNASLHEISELWCEGAGPLTANYKAEEVRFLIRALFQNTDRRAKTLSKIV